MSKSMGKEQKEQMRETDDHVMIDRLNTSFETFIEITEDLRNAYDRLRERADTMDLQLKDANRNLSDKVLELDGLSQRLNDLLQNMPGAVVAVDGSGIITHFNRAAETLLGIDGETVVGRRMNDLPVLENVLMLCRDDSAQVQGDPGEERTVLVPDGRRIVVTSRISELRTAQGEPAGRIEMLTDLTETDRLRREVHRLDTLAALGEMAAGVAHQIRNPLNGVEGFASLLQRKLSRQGDESLEDAGRFAGKIVHGVREVNAIITGMLMLAKNESLDIRPVRLDALAADVAEHLRQSASRTGLEAEVRLHAGTGDACVDGDELKLKQVLLNIGHNALESLTERECGVVRIRTCTRRGALEVRITDTGRGMASEEAGKIFHPFYTTRDAGTGLGLSVASKIVELHEGSLAVRSMPGTGTTFRVILKNKLNQRINGEKDDRARARCG